MNNDTGSRRRLLVVDDDEGFCAFLADVLTEAGYAVHAFSDSDAALSAVHTGAVHPEAVIIDLVMPKLTGRELVAALRSEPALSAVPVVLISALAVPNLAASMNTVAVFQKPFEIEELLHVIAQL